MSIIFSPGEIVLVSKTAWIQFKNVFGVGTPAEWVWSWILKLLMAVVAKGFQI